MKKQIYKSLGIAVIASAMLASCGGKKDVIEAPAGEVEIVLPCSELKSDNEYFRAFSFGESSDANVAKKKALSNAKAELAGQISTVMKVVGDNYVKSSEFNNKEELLERFEENARTVINERLNGIKPICDRLMHVTASNKYKYYIALELSGDQLVEDYYQSLTKNESLKIDYNYEKFKKTFEEEMNKLENQ